MLVTALEPHFGPLMLTAGVSGWASADGKAAAFIGHCLTRFNRGDWGEMKYPDDIKDNDEALRRKDGGRVLASYDIPDDAPACDDDRLWIICDGVGNQHLGADFCYTTILWPSEY